MNDGSDSDRGDHDGPLADVLAGRPGAWDDLVLRYERLVLSVPIRLGLPFEDAEEVFQNTWLSLYEQIRTVRDPKRITAWLVTTASRESWRLRRRNVRARTEAGEAVTPAEDPFPDPSELLEALEFESRVHNALARLRPLCRELLTQMFLAKDSPDYREVARRLEIPEGSLGPTRARCLEQLARLLEGPGGD